jgi:VanZ family protein
VYLVKRLSLYLWYFLPVILIYGIVFWLSDQPSLPGPVAYSSRFAWFKSAHILVYAGLGWFMFRAWYQTLSQKTMWFVLQISLISSLLLAMSDEWHQSFVPGRGSSVRDLGIDLLGIGAALWLQRRYNQSRLGVKKTSGKTKPQSGM